MVSRCKYDVLVLVEMEVFFHRGSITRSMGNMRMRLQTRGTQARLLQTICGESAQNSAR
jgi:hypothetical protein